MAGKEGVFVVLDVSSTMEKKYSENMTRFQFALESIKHLIRQKLLFNTKRDNVGIILMGTEEAENAQDKDNIAIFKTLDFPTIQLLNDLDELQTTNANGDIFDSLYVALDEFERAYGNKKWNKRIFVITDGESGIKDDITYIKSLAKKINKLDVKVNFIAVDFFHDIDEDDEGMEVDEDINESNNQRMTKGGLKLLAKESPNVKIFTSKMAESIYKQFKKKKTNPTVKCRCPLVITPELFIDIAVYTKTAKVEIPSLKKQSLAAEKSDDAKSAEIANERVHYVHDDPDQTPLSKEYITKAYYYGKSLVPISSTDEQLFKNQEDRCLKAIGFTDNFRVPRHHYMSSVDVVIPNPESEPDKKAFSALIQEMVQMNKVLIARYVARSNAEPKLVVLSPHVGKKGAVLYLNTLPTVEDLRDYQFESLKECTIKQEEVISGFIDSLDLEREDEEGNKEEVLKPTETYNPVLQYFYQCLEHKALNRENNLPPLDETIGEYVKPDKKLFENNKYVTFLPRVFEIKEKEEKEDKKKRVFWREMINSEINDSVTNQQRLHEKLEKQKEEAKKIISTTRPIEDFKEMIEYKQEDLTLPAMEQMKLIIVKFITESFKGSYYIKSMECLKILRDYCISEDEPELFNFFLEQLKHDFPKEKFSDFWKLVSDNRITLISSEENVKSKLTTGECKAWLEHLNKKEVITSTLKDLDEMIADID